jgi:hypothetical protein
MSGGYLVIENVPGYPPDDEPIKFGNLVDATRYAKTLVSELLEKEGTILWAEGPTFWYVCQESTTHDWGHMVEILSPGAAAGGPVVPRDPEPRRVAQDVARGSLTAAGGVRGTLGSRKIKRWRPRGWKNSMGGAKLQQARLYRAELMIHRRDF